jgi:tRNA-dihydrouridine synthase C
MRRVYPEAQQAFDEFRLVHDAGHIERWLSLHTAPVQDLAPAL